MTNPFFPNDNDDNSYLLPDNRKSGIGPSQDQKAANLSDSKPNPAADLIRSKLEKLYAQEPSAKQEIAESKSSESAHSKHQEFMFKLSTSGKSLAQIQTEWHNYYVSLPDDEKHEVWQEFYSSNTQNSHYNQYIQSTQAAQKEAEEPAKTGVFIDEDLEPKKSVDLKSKARKKAASSTKQIKKHILNTVNARGQLQARHHLQSLLFGIGVGAVVLFVTLFSFFNEIIIAPFIQPSRTVSATPIIIDSSSIAPTSTPEVIIPKINVEIPLVGFDLKSTDENGVENALEDGVTHYPTTVLPGQKGNTAFFGHSSNNIFNPGKYKFAFTLLHELVPGDTFYLTYGKKVYAYQVYDKKIVSPNNVSVLNNVAGKAATATLITCDPPGTSINRLVVWGEQVSPSPAGNAASSVDNTAGSAAAQSVTQLPSNGPSLWNRLTNFISGL